MLKIRFLQAFNGDSIAITLVSKIGTSHTILIDGGIRLTYQGKGKKKKIEYGELKKFIDEIKKEGKIIDLLILTHIDDDHIAGILEWFNNDPEAHKVIREVWFNSGRLIAKYLKNTKNPDLDHWIRSRKSTDTSIKQGIEFGKYIKAKKIWNPEIILQGMTTSRFGADFKFLSPNKEKLETLLKNWRIKDSSLNTSSKKNDYKLSLETHIQKDKFKIDKAYPNGSSIAFILTYEKKRYLFLGDSHPDVIIEGLQHFGFSKKKKLSAELVKLSHHGSQGNTSAALLEHINSDAFIISTNGRQHEHPHKQFLARLINCKPGCTLFFNYPVRIKKIFKRADYNNFSFQAIETPREFKFK